MRHDKVDRSPFSGRKLTLSKSKLEATRQCPKRLWLQVHRPEKAEFDERTLVVFAAGHRFGELARSTEPEGILVDTGYDMDAALQSTQELLSLVPARPIFEATFMREDVLIRADLLKPVDSSGLDWDLVEVKNTRQIREYHVHDVGTQAWVASEAIQLRSVQLWWRGEAKRPTSALQSAIFARCDVTTEVAARYQNFAELAASARLLLRKAEPQVRPGAQCNSPYHCEFCRYCGQETDPVAGRQSLGGAGRNRDFGTVS